MITHLIDIISPKWEKAGSRRIGVTGVAVLLRSTYGREKAYSIIRGKRKTISPKDYHKLASGIAVQSSTYPKNYFHDTKQH